MKISIVPSDNVVGVDGVFREVDLSDIDDDVHAMHLDTITGRGRVWLKSGSSLTVADAAPYQKYIARWNAEAPVVAPPLPPIDHSDMDTADKAMKAFGHVMAAWNGKTPAELRTAFRAAWKSLP